MNKEVRRIIIVLASFCILFIGLIGYLSYFQIFKADNIKVHSYNKRLWINEENVVRGRILDRNDKILAYSEKEEDSNTRHYKYGNLYSHIIGYSMIEYGKSGLELEYNDILLNINKNTAIDELKNLVLPSSIGNDLRLTIDHSTQEKSRALLQGRKGALVSMNPRTGEIYSMVSLPDFNTSNLKEEWKDITEDPDKPLFNRATQGLYPPGSTFKVISTVAALENSGIDLRYNCSGSTTIDGKSFEDYRGISHGSVDLSNALIESCNPYFAEKSQVIGREALGETTDKFMFNKKIGFDLSTRESKFNYKKGLGKADLAASSIGQGKVLATPLNMAMVASSIANNGIMVKPILVKEILDRNGVIIESIETDSLSNVTDSIRANEVKEMMKDVVSSGTGKNASISNVAVAGKTGTAEVGGKESHSWFIGFAPADNPKIAVAVILEESGLTGGQGAAPIARDLLIHGLNNINF